ncbi:MAG: MarR family winged helix-turn-helix transcriptional regulator [Oceanobacter sp.]
MSSHNVVDFGILNKLIGYRLRRAQMLFFNRFGEACADMGISPGLFGILAIVSRNPGLTQTAIAQALGNDRSAMVSAVDKLESMNLLERRPSQTDRRSYALYLTEHGEEAYPEIERKVKEQETRLYSQLAPGERDILLGLLTRLTSMSEDD